MTARCAAIVVVSLVAGCYPQIGSSNDFAVDAAFTPDELAVIGAAAEQWLSATGSDGARLSLDVGVELRSDGEPFTADAWLTWDGETANLWRVNRSEPGYADLAVAIGTGFEGIAMPGKHVALVADEFAGAELDRDRLTFLALHELGHHFGLHQGESPLMSQPQLCVDSSTVALFCSYNDCTSPKGTCP
jgi:hypothetical protein